MVKGSTIALIGVGAISGLVLLSALKKKPTIEEPIEYICGEDNLFETIVLTPCPDGTVPGEGFPGNEFMLCTEQGWEYMLGSCMFED